MGSFKNFISENPDRVYGDISWKSFDSRVFGYLGDKLFVSERKMIHADLIVELLNSKKISWNELPLEARKTGEVSRDHFKFPGRLWLEHKYISFWKFPSKSEFDKIVGDLNKHGIHVDGDWKIDLNTTNNAKSESKFLKVSEYSNKLRKIKVDQVDHVAAPEIKNQQMKNRGIKPGYTKLNLPKGMTMAQANYLKGESMSFKEFYKSLSEVASTVAPVSVSTGQYQEKMDKTSKRENDKEDEDDESSKEKK